MFQFYHSLSLLFPCISIFFSSILTEDDIINEISKKEFFRANKKITIKKTQIDFGRDRDIDLEGVHDYIMWYENFHVDGSKPPVLPR